MNVNRQSERGGTRKKKKEKEAEKVKVKEKENIENMQKMPQRDAPHQQNDFSDTSVTRNREDLSRRAHLENAGTPDAVQCRNMQPVTRTLRVVSSSAV